MTGEESGLSAEPSSSVMEALDEFLQQYEAGNSVDQEALIARYPGHEEEIRQCLQSVQFLKSAAPQVKNAQNFIGKTIGDYEILREVGRGGMGIVYEARQKSLDRRVAVKLLPFGAMLDHKSINRFIHEAQAAATLHHPHIVPVYDVGEEDGVYFYSMLFIDGESLDRDRTHDAPRFDCRTVSEWGIQVAEALHHAHRQGVIHRDVKPSNLMLDGNGKLWVTDFGLARFTNDSSLTLTGDIIGTLRYMSPEQARGNNETIDARSDVYSLGITLYELLSGHRAFEADNHQGYLRAIELEEPVALRKLNPMVPRELETIVLKAMSKLPQDRYNSAFDLAEDLQRYLRDLPTRARRPSIWEHASKWAKRHRSLFVVTLVFVMLATAGGLFGWMSWAKQSESVQSAESRANDRLQQIKQLVRKIRSDIAQQLEGVDGASEPRINLLKAAYDQMQSLADTLVRTEDRAKRAEILLESAHLAVAFADLESAEADVRTSIRLFQETDNPEWLEPLGRAQHFLGCILFFESKREQARKSFHNAVESLESALEASPDPPDGLRETLVVAKINAAANVHGSIAAEDIPLLLDAVESFSADESSLNAERTFQLSVAHHRLSHAYARRSLEKAEEHAELALRHLQHLVRAFPSAGVLRLNLVTCYGNLANLALRKERVEDAEKHLSSANRYLDSLKTGKMQENRMKLGIETAARNLHDMGERIRSNKPRSKPE